VVPRDVTLWVRSKVCSSALPANYVNGSNELIHEKNIFKNVYMVLNACLQTFLNLDQRWEEDKEYITSFFSAFLQIFCLFILSIVST
jgi:hypothetical protein